MPAISFKAEMNKQMAFDLFVNNSVNEIFNVVKPMKTGNELGIPELGPTPSTKDLAQRVNEYKKMHVDSKVRNVIDEVIDHSTRFFTVLIRKVSELSNRSLVEISRVETNLDDPYIRIRDFDADPECAELLRALATRHDGFATYFDLEILFPYWSSEKIEQKIDRCLSLWKDIIFINRETGMITLSDSDYRSIRAINCATTEIGTNARDALNKMRDDEIKEKVGLYRIIYSIVKKTDPKYCKHIEEKLNKYYDMKLDKYPTLFDQTIIHNLGLHENKIRRASDFLRTPYRTLVKLFNRSIQDVHFDIGNMKLKLASRLNWDCKDFEIDILHESAFTDYEPSSIKKAVELLNAFLLKKNNIVNNQKQKATYGMVVKEKEILLDDSFYERYPLSYKIIAFIRDVYVKTQSDSQTFRSYNPGWVFPDLLTNEEQLLFVRTSPGKSAVNEETLPLSEKGIGIDSDTEKTGDIGNKRDGKR